MPGCRTEEVFVPVDDVKRPVLTLIYRVTSCDIWLIDIHSVPQRAKAANKAGVAQGDITHQLKVAARDGGGLTLEQIVPSTANLSYHFIHGDFFEEGLSVASTAISKRALIFRTTQITITKPPKHAHDYNVLPLKASYGEGLMTVGFLAFPDANNLDLPPQ